MLSSRITGPDVGSTESSHLPRSGQNESADQTRSAPRRLPQDARLQALASLTGQARPAPVVGSLCASTDTSMQELRAIVADVSDDGMAEALLATEKEESELITDVVHELAEQGQDASKAVEAQLEENSQAMAIAQSKARQQALDQDAYHSALSQNQSIVSSRGVTASH